MPSPDRQRLNSISFADDKDNFVMQRIKPSGYTFNQLKELVGKEMEASKTIPTQIIIFINHEELHRKALITLTQEDLTKERNSQDQKRIIHAFARTMERSDIVTIYKESPLKVKNPIEEFVNKEMDEALFKSS